MSVVFMVIGHSPRDAIIDDFITVDGELARIKLSAIQTYEIRNESVLRIHLTGHKIDIRMGTAERAKAAVNELDFLFLYAKQNTNRSTINVQA